MNNNEIDILQLLIQVFNFFKKYFWIYISFFVFGVFIGIARVYFSQNNYISNIIVTSSIDKNIIIDLINSFSNIKNSDNIDQVQTKYHLPRNFFSSIVDINATENNKTDQILISTRLNSKTYFDTLTTGINLFLSNNTFIQQEIESKRKGLNELITEIDSQITKLNDNAKNNYPTQKIILLDNKQIINEQVNLLEKKIELVDQLKLTKKPITIIKNFDDIISGKSVLKSSFLYGFICGFLSIIIIVLIKINKLANNYSEKE